MKSLNNSVFLPLMLTAVLMALVFGGQMLYANVTATQYNLDYATEKYRFFATTTAQTIYSTSTTALSTSITPWTDSSGRIDNGYFVVDGAQRVTFYFQREGKLGNEGSSAFDVDVSYDGSTWHDFNQLIGTAATSTPAYIGGFTLTGTTTQIASMNLLHHNFYAVRCNVTETTDGEHFCKAQADY